MSSPKLAIDKDVLSIIKTFARINTEVPEKTQESLKKIGSLDEEARFLLDEVQKTKVQFMANYEKMTMEQRSKAYTFLQSEMEKIAAICDQKVEIARKMRETLEDVHDEFEMNQKKFIEHQELPSPPQKAQKKVRMAEMEDEDVVVQKTTPEEKKRGRKKKKSDVVVKTEEGEEGGGATGEDTEDEEQKMYCWCKLEKQDQMVACENPTCKYEWFHFSCIGMVKAPTDLLWYCGNECRQAAEGIPTTSEGEKKTPKKPGPKKRK